MCQDSPNVGKAVQALFVLQSRVGKGELPKTCEIEPRLQEAWWTRNTPHQAAPQEAGEGPHPRRGQHPSQNGRDRQPEQDPGEVGAVDRKQGRVAEQVDGVTRPVGIVVGEHPTDVGMPEPQEEAADPLAMAEVGGMGIARLVAMGVVTAVDGDPVEQGPLRGHRAEDR